MDRTSIIAIVICLLLIGLWTVFIIPKYTPKPLPSSATNAPASTVTATNQPGATPTPAPLSETPVTVIKPVANTNVPEELRVVTNASARYTFTSHGGGLKLIELLQYPETVARLRKGQPQTNRVATLNSFIPAPTLALLGDDAVQ